MKETATDVLCFIFIYIDSEKEDHRKSLKMFMYSEKFYSLQIKVYEYELVAVSELTKPSEIQQ